MDDKALQEAVAQAVERLSDGAPVAASVAGGVVTLTGAVQDEMRRTVIEQELLRLPEVLDVRNHLHVAAPVGDLRTQLRILLETHDVEAGGIVIEEADGALTLSGTATGWFDRDAAERLAWTLPGVASVTNRIVLPPDAVEPDDGSAGLPS